MIKILLVEDDKIIVASLSEYLNSEGYLVRSVSGQAAAMKLLAEEKADLVLLDVSLAEGNGFAACRAIKAEFDIPVIFLTASGDEFSTVTGFDLGADDYIAKPFNPVEIVARVKAQLRRANRTTGSTLTVRDLTLDTASFQLWKDGRQILLTPMEYKILAMLMRSPGRIFTKIQLYEGAIGTYFEGDDNTMMVHISKLREKIEDDPKNPRYIITVRGLGYKIEK